MVWTGIKPGNNWGIMWPDVGIVLIYMNVKGFF